MHMFGAYDECVACPGGSQHYCEHASDDECVCGFLCSCVHVSVCVLSQERATSGGGR